MALVKNWQFFHIFNIGKIANQNVFECILERKKAFPDYKNNKLKRSKIWDFSKIVHGFGQKLAMFLSLYYRQNRPGKMFLGIFYKEKKPFHTIKIAS